MTHEHDWTKWTWDGWVYQQRWWRSCLVRGCLAFESTEDITVVNPAIVIDEEREWLLPDGNVEYTEFGLELIREYQARQTAPPWPGVTVTGETR